MKVLIFAQITFLLLATTAFSADQKTRTSSKVKPDKSENTMNIEPNSKDEEIIESTATLTDKHSMKAHVICKGKDGHELKQGEVGYEACIQKVKADKNTKSEPAAAVEVKLEK